MYHDILNLSISQSENNTRVASPNGLTQGRKFSRRENRHEHLEEAGSRASCKITSVGLHSILIGKPGGTFLEQASFINMKLRGELEAPTGRNLFRMHARRWLDVKSNEQSILADTRRLCMNKLARVKSSTEDDRKNYHNTIGSGRPASKANTM